MTIEVALIRHGQIRPDGERRLVGITDEPLGDEGKRMLAKKKEAGAYPDMAIVYTSDLKRCKETAGLIYPSRKTIFFEDRFNAPNYGDFDGRAISELKNDEAFRQWQSSKAVRACPNGESPEDFSMRVLLMFKKACGVAESSKRSGVAVVCHRTVINEILRRYYTPRSNYKDWDVAPGCGYLLQYDTETLTAKITGKF